MIKYMTKPLSPKLWIIRSPIVSSSDRVRHFSREEELESYKLKKFNEIY